MVADVEQPAVDGERAAGGEVEGRPLIERHVEEGEKLLLAWGTRKPPGEAGGLRARVRACRVRVCGVRASESVGVSGMCGGGAGECGRVGARAHEREG